ncbi:MAG: hypothetical protein QG628_876 [Patescibacteria group bacterium]|nr:hypothetical protein [Patescibacteria group bacterium]
MLVLLRGYICSILITIKEDIPMANTKKTIDQTKPVSAFSLFSKSYYAVMKNLNLFIIVGGSGLVAQYVLGLQIKAPEVKTQYFTISPQDAGVFTVALIASIVLYTMSIKLQLSVAQGKKPTMKALWEFARDNTFKLIGLGIILSVVITVGLIAFIIPGLIFIRRYVLSPYVLADKKIGILESMKQSAELSKPYSGAIWGVIGVSILLSLVSVFGAVGTIISAILAVLYSVAPALRYEELKKLSKT